MRVGDDGGDDLIGLEENRDFLLDILNSLHSAVIVTGLDGAVYLENKEAERLGLDISEFIGGWLAMVKKSAKKKIEWDAQDGQKLAISISPLKRKGGEAAGYIFVVDDVTEVAKLKKQSLRANRLQAIGQMAAEMAHEIRNPLGGMEIFTSLLLREFRGDKEKTRLLTHISTGVHAINNVVSNFLLFTKEPKPVKRKFDLKKLILDTLEFAGYVFKQNGISVETDLPDGDIVMVADPDLIRQTLLNMINNSAQAMPDGGFFYFGVKVKKSAEGVSSVEITIRDTGRGVPEQVKEKIFDPFFSTKESGAGLGLAIVNQITRAHGGYVDLDDGAQNGATFVISLPLSGEMNHQV